MLVEWSWKIGFGVHFPLNQWFYMVSLQVWKVWKKSGILKGGQEVCKKSGNFTNISKEFGKKQNMNSEISFDFSSALSRVYSTNKNCAFNNVSAAKDVLFLRTYPIILLLLFLFKFHIWLGYLNKIWSLRNFAPNLRIFLYISK